jgi:hypothetical protein
MNRRLRRNAGEYAHADGGGYFVHYEPELLRFLYWPKSVGAFLQRRFAVTLIAAATKKCCLLLGRPLHIELVCIPPSASGFVARAAANH